ncbi:SCO family protein [Halomonas sp. TRM85114]|uniref:SCO family protein n=1 Tax=Halomonas jincaotanensis TaxID=2810616 RepID=UPI001BD291E3|nr:SCO family protein [Halomonas jincaotanensis]MBS9404645.1 SCO family protein [Halomonas jincaotanensis]
MLSVKKHKGLWLGLGTILLLAGFGGGAWYLQQADGRDDGPPGGEVSLPSTQGDFSLSELGEDQLAVLFFGYTYCPDVCPMTLSVVRQALAGLDEAQRERVVPLMVSVDPERDTLERLEEYTAYFGAGIIGATGSQQQLDDIAERYGVVWRKVETPDSAMAYTIDHSSSLYLVDNEGDIRRRVLYSPVPNALRSALESELEG